MMMMKYNVAYQDDATLDTGFLLHTDDIEEARELVRQGDGEDEVWIENEYGEVIE